MNTSLYRRLCSWDNLLLAHRKASKGKRGKAPAASFEYHLEDNLVTLQAELGDKTYQPGAYYSFYIKDPKPTTSRAASVSSSPSDCWTQRLISRSCWWTPTRGAGRRG